MLKRGVLMSGVRRRQQVMIAAMLLLIIAVITVGLVRHYWFKAPVLTISQITTLQVEAGAGRNDASLNQLEQAATDQPQAAAALGFALLQRQQYQKALTWLQKAADAHNAQAQFALGRLYFYGQLPDIKQDYQQAFHWFKQSATAHYAPATYYMGLIYKSGYGQRINLAEAFKWFQQGAEQQQAASIFMLANAYRYGEGVAQNDKEALRLYEIAADMDQPEAVQTLIMAYRHGEMGLKADPHKSEQEMWEIAHAIKNAAYKP